MHVCAVSPRPRAAVMDKVTDTPRRCVSRTESRDEEINAGKLTRALPLLSALPRWPRGAGKVPRSSSARPSSLVASQVKS